VVAALSVMNQFPVSERSSRYEKSFVNAAVFVNCHL
jgi:hypothetical protein